MTERERKRRVAQAVEAAAPRFLGVDDLAERWHTTPAGIYQLRHRGTAPPAHRIGKRLLFDVDDVVAFEAGRRDEPLDAA